MWTRVVYWEISLGIVTQILLFKHVTSIHRADSVLYDVLSVARFYSLRLSAVC